MPMASRNTPKNFNLIAVGFRGPKFKNQHGGTVLDDTNVSGRRSEMMKEGKKVAWV